MCYPKPGPRCAAHARADLKENHQAYRDDPTPNNYEKFMKAQKDYDATPGGAKELKREIDGLNPVETKPDRRTRTGVRTERRRLTADERLYVSTLNQRIQDGKERRKKQMQDLINAQGVEQAEASGIGAPILLEKTPLSDPRFGPGDLQYGGVDLDIEYSRQRDYYAYNGGDYNEGDYYDNDTYHGNYRTIESIQISSVDVPEVLATVFRTSRANITQEMISFANSIDLENYDSYETENIGGYYDDEAIVNLKADKVAQLQEWYYQKGNAEDKQGILGYVRSKGVETSGLSPIEAIKTQLRSENDDKRVKIVEETDTITTENIKLDKLKIPHPTRLNNVEARQMVGYGGSNKFAGVVVLRDGKHVLVDGYHRTKGLHESNRKSATYIVLSKEN